MYIAATNKAVSDNANIIWLVIKLNTYSVATYACTHVCICRHAPTCTVNL